MKRMLLFALYLSSLFGAAQAQAPLSLSLPELTGLEAGTTLQIPIALDAEVPRGTEIFSFQGTVAFDAAVLRITGVTNGGTLTDGWLLVPSMGPDRVRFASTSARPIAREDAPGILLLLEAKLIAEGTSPLIFTDFMFNEGNPTAATTDGFVRHRALGQDKIR